jgi:hypothetical protein
MLTELLKLLKFMADNTGAIVWVEYWPGDRGLRFIFEWKIDDQLFRARRMVTDVDIEQAPPEAIISAMIREVLPLYRDEVDRYKRGGNGKG